ncbi:MAG: tellurite resistance/C4-dicarboxylate transporter family protein [Streptosporangiaceae bacterium]
MGEPGPAPHEPVLVRLRGGVRDLFPGYFALVMATGIVSTAVGADGSAGLSAALLVLSIICYLVLIVLYCWRFARYRREFLASATDPRTAFSLFTFIAASDVLGSRLAADGHFTATVVLLVVAGLAWLLLCYGGPLYLITGHGTRSALAGINGSWFLWVVGTQSLAVTLASLAPPVHQWLATLAAMLWTVGVVLYLIIATLVFAGLLHFPVQPASLTPAYWVFMGATAISVLAGAKVLGLPADPVLTAIRPVLSGVSVILWAFGTWLIPLLLGLGVWRHLIRRVPLRYDPGLWSLVFPLGMYCVASETLGAAQHVHWQVTLGHDGSWVAFAVWAAVFAAMIGFLISGTASRRTLASGEVGA